MMLYDAWSVFWMKMLFGMRESSGVIWIIEGPEERRLSL